MVGILHRYVVVDVTVFVRIAIDMLLAAARWTVIVFVGGLLANGKDLATVVHVRGGAVLVAERTVRTGGRRQKVKVCQFVRRRLIAGPTVDAARRRTDRGHLRERRKGRSERRAQIRGRAVGADVARLPGRLSLSPFRTSVL